MEVHHHTHTASDPDSHRGRKKWAHYFWEFLMLFLAVFCGFLAEYQLEHKIEHQREKQFIRSLANDIKADIVMLNRIINSRTIKQTRLDSLSLLINKSSIAGHENNIYYFATMITRGIGTRFTANDGTMQQLKNAGGLRLIRKPPVADSIVKYDVAVRNLIRQGETEEHIYDVYRTVVPKIFDGRVFDKMSDTNNYITRPTDMPALLAHNGATINEFNYQLHLINTMNKVNKRDGRILLQQASNLLNTLNKEYHLE